MQPGPSQPPPLDKLTASTSNPLLRFAPVAIGVLLAVLASGVATWKSSSAESARGKVRAIELKIEKLEDKLKETDDSDKEERYEDQIKNLKEEGLPDANENAAEEAVDALQGVWLISMLQWLGVSIASLGFVMIAFVGTPHERMGALIGIAFLLLILRSGL